MKDLAPYPVIFELNAFAWVNQLSRKYGRQITLANVPGAEWDKLKIPAIDAIWLMGVWQRSPEGIHIAMEREDMMKAFRETLPDLKDEDICGSPYCVKAYEVDAHLGGRKGLEIARNQLINRGLRLILDFVPNHTAPDHEWTIQHPEYYINGTKEDLQDEPSSYLEIKGKVIARARDPYYPAWPDVVQLNAFNQDLRKNILRTLLDLASQCDGIRCDMAMLMKNIIFEKTWAEKAGPVPEDDFWPKLISKVKDAYPEFKFIAEVYWDMEWDLQQDGFDYCYDKRLYDRLIDDSAESIRLHLQAELTYQDKLIRFIENHDEPRVASILSQKKEKAAMVVLMTLPGAKLLHEGQIEGKHIKLPVFLGRKPEEEEDKDLQAFYRKLLKTVEKNTFKKGQWRLLQTESWNHDEAYKNILAWGIEDGQERYLIAVNYCEGTSRGRIIIPWFDLMGKEFILDDQLSGNYYDRSGDQLKFHGLYVELGPWQYHFFRFTL